MGQGASIESEHADAGVAAGMPRVLVVDDNAANLAAFEAILSDSNLELVTAQSGVEAMRHLLHGEFAAILLDINMPTLDGIETARLIRRRERSQDIPIILITAYQPDQMQLLRGYSSGAVDYLVKPVLPDILRAKVRIFVDLFRKKKQVEWQATQLRAINLRLQQEMESRKEAERDAAYEREERQRVALMSIADAVITTDGGGNVTSLNTMAERLTGWTSSAARGVPLRQVCSAVVDAGQMSPHESVARGETWRVVEPVEIVAGDGAHRYIDWSVAPVRDRLGAITGAVLVAHDVTDRHRAELERGRALRSEQEARRHAERANRARDEFLAVISHELRTPLNAIVGWTHILRKPDLDRGQMQRAVEAIHRSAMAQNKLIEDLLDMSRIINGKVNLARGPVDLGAVVRAAVETVRPVGADKGITLEAVIDESIGTAAGDAMRLEQVVWNLLTNAVKFTPHGGRVDVHTEKLKGAARIVIADSGQGIEPAFLPQMFEAFRQADSTTTRKQGGLGLGLAIARQLITMHGGSITAASEGRDRGATFTITLPTNGEVLTALPPAPAQPLLMQDGPAELDALHVLVVDDDANTREMVSFVLREHGATVTSAATAREAMQAILERRPDVLVCDISMPEEDGYSLIGRVRALPADRSKPLPAIALTAMASAEDRDRAMAAGFDRHIVKPVQFGILMNAIAVLARRQ